MEMPALVITRAKVQSLDRSRKDRGAAVSAGVAIRDSLLNVELQYNRLVDKRTTSGMRADSADRNGWLMPALLGYGKEDGDNGGECEFGCEARPR
jgi:hypothetical protein